MNEFQRKEMAREILRDEGGVSEHGLWSLSGKQVG